MQSIVSMCVVNYDHHHNNTNHAFPDRIDGNREKTRNFDVIILITILLFTVVGGSWRYEYA